MRTALDSTRAGASRRRRTALRRRRHRPWSLCLGGHRWSTSGCDSTGRRSQPSPRPSEPRKIYFALFDAATASAYAATGEGRWSCGGYESENRGAQLIAKVDGSLHVVLGLPLFSVLAALRQLAPGLLLGRATP